MVNTGIQIAIVAFGANLFLSIYVLLKNKGWSSMLNRSFSSLSLTFSLWNLGIATSYPLLSILGLVFAPSSLLFFFLILLRRNHLRERQINRVILAVSSILSTAFLLSYKYANKPAYVYSAFYLLSMMVITPVFVWCEYQLFHQIKRSASRQERYRLIYVFVGVAASGLGGISALFHLFHAGFPALGAHGSLVYTGLITIAIMRHRLFDFGTLAGRAIVIFVFTFVFWLLFGILGFWYVETDYTPFFSLLIAVFVLVVSYEPLKALVEGQADRVLSRDSLVFCRALQSFSREMISLLSEQDLVRGLSRTLRNSERIKSFGIYLNDPLTGMIVIRDGDDIRVPPGSVVQVSPVLLETLQRTFEPVSLSQITFHLRTGLSTFLKQRYGSLYRTLSRLRAQSIFSLIFAEQFLGFVTMGFQDSEAELTRREEETLISVLRQFAAALAHARMIEKEKAKEHLVGLGKLASGLAHELRNPLATIKAAVQYLEPGSIEPKDKEFFTMILDESDRLNRFVERFLSYAKPSRVEGDVSKETLNTILSRIILPYQVKNHSPEIQFKMDLANECADLLVPGDAWHQILSNLIANAVQAIDKKGVIHIEAVLDSLSHKLVLTVEDSGHGILPEDIPKVMQPFYTTRAKGTGLGLAIVHQVLQSLKAEISVGVSAYGGARFSICQPLP